MGATYVGSAHTATSNSGERLLDVPENPYARARQIATAAAIVSYLGYPGDDERASQRVGVEAEWSIVQSRTFIQQNQTEFSRLAVEWLAEATRLGVSVFEYARASQVLKFSCTLGMAVGPGGVKHLCYLASDNQWNGNVRQGPSRAGWHSLPKPTPEPSAAVSVVPREARHRLARPSGSCRSLRDPNQPTLSRVVGAQRHVWVFDPNRFCL